MITDIKTIEDFIDVRDGQSYKMIRVGDLIWFDENFKFKTSDSAFLENNINYEHYGRCYSLSSAIKNCPRNWHLPTNDEWITLLESLIYPEKSTGFILFNNEMTGSVDLKMHFINNDPLNFLSILDKRCGYWTRGGRNPRINRSWEYQNGIFDSTIIFREDIKLFVRYVKMA